MQVPGTDPATTIYPLLTNYSGSKSHRKRVAVVESRSSASLLRVASSTNSCCLNLNFSHSEFTACGKTRQGSSPSCKTSFRVASGSTDVLLTCFLLSLSS